MGSGSDVYRPNGNDAARHKTRSAFGDQHRLFTTDTESAVSGDGTYSTKFWMYNLLATDGNL